MAVDARDAGATGLCGRCAIKRRRICPTPKKLPARLFVPCCMLQNTASLNTVNSTNIVRFLTGSA